MASTSRMLARNRLPRPSPLLAPSTRPPMSTNCTRRAPRSRSWTSRRARRGGRRAPWPRPRWGRPWRMRRARRAPAAGQGVVQRRLAGVGEADEPEAFHEAGGTTRLAGAPQPYGVTAVAPVGASAGERLRPTPATGRPNRAGEPCTSSTAARVVRARSGRSGVRHDVVGSLDGAELEARVAAGTLTDLDGIGPVTAEVIADAVPAAPTADLSRAVEAAPLRREGGAYRGRPPRRLPPPHELERRRRAHPAMADTAIALGHEYLVVTDHSPRLTVAHGLDDVRLRRQIDEIAAINAGGRPVPGAQRPRGRHPRRRRLDLSEEMLGELDVVVASVHSKLRMTTAR